MTDISGLSLDGFLGGMMAITQDFALLLETDGNLVLTCGQCNKGMDVELKTVQDIRGISFDALFESVLIHETAHQMERLTNPN